LILLLNDLIISIIFDISVSFFILNKLRFKDKLIRIYYSPCTTFNRANPNERPNKVMKKQVTAAVTISGLANGKMLRTKAIIFKKF